MKGLKSEETHEELKLLKSKINEKVLKKLLTSYERLYWDITTLLMHCDPDIWGREIICKRNVRDFTFSRRVLRWMKVISGLYSILDETRWDSDLFWKIVLEDWDQFRVWSRNWTDMTGIPMDLPYKTHSCSRVTKSITDNLY